MSANFSTTSQWLKHAASELTAAGIGTARLDSLVLLEDILNTNRTRLLAHPDMSLSSEQLQRLTSALNRRIGHEPLAYIRGKTEFYGREFVITPAVLEPRPESETMIELLKRLSLPTYPAIVDVGTGSGALGITAKLELPKSTVCLTDIDTAALKIAEQNCQKLNADLSIVEDDLLTHVPVHLSYQIVLANLPYVPDSYTINEAASMEPRLAIFGGSDGLDLYRKLFAQLNEYKWEPLFVLTESLPFQHEELMNIATAQKFSKIDGSDFIQVFARN